jgi:hypothetical protein
VPNQDKNGKKKNENIPPSPLKPDPETLHTTDPQEHMKGPNSSAMQKLKDIAEKNDEQSKKEAEEKRNKNM